jgi:hypothetical protein
MSLTRITRARAVPEERCIASEWELNGPRGAIVLGITTKLVFDVTWQAQSLHPPMIHIHSRRPLSIGHRPKDNCRILSGDCYGDGSYTHGTAALKALMEGGEDVLWDFMERYYDLHLPLEKT